MNKDTMRTVLKFVFLILGVIAILFATNFPLMLMQSNDITIDSSIKISCFEVINFAIAVWASLNIVNYFDRKEFEKYKQTSQTEMEKFKTEQNTVANEIRERNDMLGDIFYAQFLQELLKTVKDPISERFYKDFNKTDIDKDNYPFEVLLVVERLYEQAYQLYYDGNEGVDIGCIKVISQKGIDSIRDCISFLRDKEIKNNLIDSYLVFREAEFYYYSNFKGSAESNSVGQMKSAARLYIQALEMLGIKIKELPSQLSISDINEIDRKLCAYSLNTVGSVYNWLYKYMPEDYAKSADNYCSSAVICAGSEYQREVYFRNCGVAKEHIGDFDAAYEKYKKALDTTDISTKTMHCILSVLDKQINKINKIEQYVDPNVSRAILYGSPRHLVTLKEIDIEDLKKKQISLKTYCDFTKSIFPKHIDGYLYSAIYYRNSVLVTLLESDRTGILGPASNFYASKYYINEAQKNLDVALLLNPENDYAIVINNDIRALREYVK